MNVSVVRRQQEFLAGRPRVSDASFCDQIGADPELRSLIGLIRHSVGKLCGVSAGVIAPEDQWSTLIHLLDHEWDDVEFVMMLEEILGVEIADSVASTFPRLEPGRLFWIRWPGPDTFGGWVLGVAEALAADGVPTANSSR